MNKSFKSQTGAVPLLILIGTLGIIAFLTFTSLGLTKNPTLSRLFPILFSQAAGVTNLLTNGGFESDFTSWNKGSGTGWTVTSPGYAGTKMAHYSTATNSDLIQNFSNLKTNAQYKVSFWVRINSQSCPAGGCWGDFRASLGNNDWKNQFSGPDAVSVTTGNTTVGIWTKKSFIFTTGTVTSGELWIHNWGTNTYDVDIDDVKLFELTGTPISPTVAITSDQSAISSITTPVVFNSTADDDDGSINYYFWDFGDGGKSNLPNPSYRYSSNGTFQAQLTVYDDAGLSSSAQKNITVNDPSLPSLTLSTPSNVDTTNGQASIAGSAQAGVGKSIVKVDYSTDRGIVGSAAGNSSWTLNFNAGTVTGPHKVLISATNSSGEVASKTVVVNYKPASKIAIQNGSAGVVQNNSNIQLYDKFEATFNVINGQFSNPYFPYETVLPDGMSKGSGVTIEATFTSPTGKTYKQPAFYYQNYQRVISTKQLIASGDPVWKIRFAPTELGKWDYSISLTDASGNTILNDPAKLTFTAVAQTNPFNHGFLQVSSKDQRYFEFSDGTPFVGVGPGPVIDDTFTTDTNLSQFVPNSANLSRTWMSGANISGSSWSPWAGGIGNVSNSPGTSLTTEQSYSDGIYSFTLPTQGPGSDPANPANCVFYGFYGNKPSVKTNTNYRVMVRLKTVGVTGSGGFTIRPVGINWPGGGCNSFAAQGLTIPYQKGTQDWHVVTGNWNSGSLTKLGFMLATLENITGGRVYIDEISVREDLGGGQLGPEVLSRSKFNVQNYFSQEPSYNWDYGLEKFAEAGIYEKVVIQEKDDYSYNYIAPSGFGYDKGDQRSILGGASMKYQEYFWRYLTARYGYSRAVHSWEYANEQSPGSLTEAQELAKYIKNIDPNKHMSTSSNWAGLNGGWTNPAYPDISNADVHAYVTAGSDNTTWLSNGVDPLTNVFTGDDTAVFSAGHSLNAYSQNLSGNRPWIMGEAGAGKNGVTAGNNDTQTKGDWFHQFIWGQINSGGMYFIYWYDQTIRSNNLSTLVVPYREFMEGKSGDTVNTRIPLNNSKYADIQLSLPSGVRGWGQKDVTNGGAHFWIYDTSYTWINPTGGASLAGKTISFAGMPAKNYVVEFWNTWTGNVTKQTVNHGGGTMTITIPGTLSEKDAAVKIYPATGYISTTVVPSSVPSASPVAVKPGDVDGNGRVDIFDYNTLLTNYGKTGSGIAGDLDQNGKVDIFDYNTLLTNFGR